MPRPNFFLIGAPKCGTTAVAKALGRHPDIFMSDPKEPSYFLYTQDNPYGLDPETRVSRPEDYLALFAQGEGKKILGEASPLYIYAPHVADELAQFNPQSRIMAILRNPIERACSMYLFWHQYDRRAQLTPHDFREKFNRGMLSHVPVGEARRQMEMLKSFGYYCKLLQPYYKVFSRDRVLVMAHEDLRRDGASFSQQVLTFLEVDSSVPLMITRENITLEPRNRELQYWLNHAVSSRPRELLKRLVGFYPRTKALRDAFNRMNQKAAATAQFLSDELHREMIETYREDINRLSDLVGRDFTPWLERKKVAQTSAVNC